MRSRRSILTLLFASCLTLLTWLNAPLANAMGGKLPPINQPAPEFTLPTNIGDGEISLAELQGKWLVVYFYPKDFTAGCTIEARRFQQDLPKYLEKNTQIIGISADSVDSHAEFCDFEGLKFPLLADTSGSVSKAYGSWMGAVSVRHSFIIDPQGILRETFVKVNPTVHSSEVIDSNPLSLFILAERLGDTQLTKKPERIIGNSVFSVNPALKFPSSALV